MELSAKGSRQGVGLAIDCLKVFVNAHLHLLVWGRLNAQAHSAGLQLLGGLLEAPGIGDRVLLLLRPVGRGQDAIRQFGQSFAEQSDGEPPDPSGWSELWVQVSCDDEARAWSILKDWAECAGHGPAKAWRSHTNPLWQPLSDGITNCGYAAARSPHADLWLSQLEDDHVAWLLKVVWHRASVVIAEEFSERSDLRVAPWCEQERIAGLLGRILSPFDPVQYSIPTPSGLFDPSAFSASHLAAFALNAVTQDRSVTVWQLEQFWHSGDLTHPARFENLQKYLDAVRGARC